jgi:hypothetical protein
VEKQQHHCRDNHSAAGWLVRLEPDTASRRSETATDIHPSLMMGCPYLSRLLSPENLPNVGLFVAATAGMIVALGTLRIIKRQTRSIHHQAVQVRKQTEIFKISADAASKSADAAFLNAQAVIDAERSWLVVTVEKNELMGTSGYFFFRVTNKGRTPAQFVSGGFAIDFRASPNQLPIPPSYEPFFAPNNVFLPPGDHFDIKRTIDEANTGIRPEQIISSRSLERGPVNAADILFFYGNIVYDDVLGKGRPGYTPHETRWCFAFFKSGLRFVRTGPDGSDEYNRYT